MSALDKYDGGSPARQERPPGARQLGVRVDPLLRLGMGYQHPQKNYPIKTDYFTVRGDERAVRKFREVKGDQPKHVTLRLPSEFSRALQIGYLAFRGGTGDTGGVLIARGHTNFALTVDIDGNAYAGGPDTLTVYDPDGTVREVETLGLDAHTKEPLDDVARELGLELYTTLTAGMPEVLGRGSVFQISTKGKKSTDNLWLKLQDLYGEFGAQVSYVVRPELVLRQSTARPVVVKDGESKRIKSTIYVLDIVIPESDDEMLKRLRQRQELLTGGRSPVEALYGAPREIGSSISPSGGLPGEAAEAPDASGGGQQAAAGEPGDGGADPAAVPDTGEDDSGEDEPVLEGEIVDADDLTATVITFGDHEGKTLAEIAEIPGSETWFAWAMNNPKRVPADLYPRICAFIEQREAAQ